MAQGILAEYAGRAAEEARLMQRLSPTEGMSRRDEFLLPIGEDTGNLLALLIRSARPRRILEIGTSYGYSTLFLADAARTVGAGVTTLELAQHKSDYARDALTRAGLAAQVEFRVGDALEILPALPGPFDFVLLDLWKELYVPCLDLVRDRLSPGAFIAADNMIHPQEVRAEADAYRRRVRELRLDSILLPVGSGVELSRRV